MKQAGAIMLATTVLCLCLASTASAQRLIFWSNSLANKISYASLLEGHRAGDLPIDPADVNDPYGTAIDASTGKIYWLNRGGGGSIGWANLGSPGAGILNTAGAAFADPSGLAIYPATGKIYWGNSESGNGSIGYANLDNSGGGLLKPTGATLEPNAVAVDPAAGRLYWSNFAANTISYANLDGSGARDIDTADAAIDGPKGLAVDTRLGKVYWANWKGDSLGYASVNGGAGGEAFLNEVVSKPIGLATAGEAVYWASEERETVVAGNFGACCVVSLEAMGATQSGVAFPVILEGPRSNEITKVEGAHSPGSTLSCSPGSWDGDEIGSFFYRAPQSTAYQWFRNLKPIAGATARTVTASKVGSYTCELTATNFAEANHELSPHKFNVNATVVLKRVAFNRKKGTATLRVAVTGAGRLDLYGAGVANVSRKKATGTAKLVVRSSGKARIKLNETGRAKVRATISYTPEGGKAIKRRKTVVLKKKLKR
ncbi:MAG TPA: hypothetical protein VH042_07240 [Solirubrobacterales bacterium]|nr:hypothetical protein [Solirubrobacterales bacterium]